jgi:hypothetical protein
MLGRLAFPAAAALAVLVVLPVAAAAPAGRAAMQSAAPTSGVTAVAAGAGSGSIELRSAPTSRPRPGSRNKGSQGAAAQSPRAAGSRIAPTVGPLAPVAGPSWEGANDQTLSPPDTNGAIGPHSYIESINLQIGIYNRTGAVIATGSLQTLTGHPQFNMTDPMVLWDPDTKRFYYNAWDTTQASMAFGFSKSSNPTNLGAEWCKYTATFGYASTNAPDYPKLGQTKNFLLMGVNFYPSFSSLLSTQSDLLWVTKPAGAATISTCPSAVTFKAGKFSDLRNVDNTQAFTPVPAIQADPASAGWVTATADVENGSSGNFLTIFRVRPSVADPTVAEISAPHAIAVGSYSGPLDAPQAGTDRVLDTLDGRVTHAVAAIDPRIPGPAVWTSHAINGGAGSRVRWYEIHPTPLASPSIFQSGVVSNASLYIFNPAISPDRTVNSNGAAHGSSMVMGFTTSSSTTQTAIRMVSKVGSAAQSGLVLVKLSPGKNEDFSCTTAGSTCRWGDYGGATPDPAAGLTAARGKVWLTNEWNATSTNPNGVWWRTWNWAATP